MLFQIEKDEVKIKMGIRWIIIVAFLGIIASTFIILLGIYFTPEFVARNLSPDGILETSTVAKINTFRMAGAITGLLLLIFSIVFVVEPYLLYSIVNWLQKRSLKERSFISLILLFVFACVCYLPFTYQGELGEKDSYRMVTGYLDSINSGTPFISSFLYARHTSFGYYAWLYLFSDVVQARPPFVIELMNYSNAIAAVLMVIPFFFVVSRYWGLGTAVGANLILMLIPVWWQLSRYGHPQLPAITFMFIGIALLCYRSHLESEHYSKAKIFACDILITAAFSFCLMIRLDAILMFPLILGCLILERFSFKTATYRFVAYSILPLLIRFAANAFLPVDVSQTSGVNPFHLLWKYHTPTRMVEHFGLANKLFFTAYPPFLIMIFIIACLYLLRARKYSSLFFVVPVVLINYIFWLSNPYLARHFVYLSPTLSIGIAMLLSSMGERLRSLIPYNKLVIHTGILLVFLFAFLSVSKLDGIKLYRNQFSSSEQAYNAGRLGQDLQKLPALNNPIFVIANAEPVIVNMQLNADSMTLTRENSFKVVYNGKNKFIFDSRASWSLKGLVALKKKTEDYDEFYWIVDPYDPSVQKIIKSFNFEAPFSAKQLDGQGSHDNVLLQSWGSKKGAGGRVKPVPGDRFPIQP